MQTLSGRVTMRGERAAGEPERPRPRERSRLDDEDRSRLEERRPSRDWDRDRSFTPFLPFLQLLPVGRPLSHLLPLPLLPLLSLVRWLLTLLVCCIQTSSACAWFLAVNLDALTCRRSQAMNFLNNQERFLVSLL